MAINYSFHPKLVLRTPAYPLSTKTVDETIINDKSFLESLFLASPSLTNELYKTVNTGKTDKKMLLSLNKYWSRAGSRCTPFGLFSGCSTATWSTDETQVQLDQATIKRHSRLDMHYSCALAQHFTTLPFIRPFLIFYPNNSIYLFGDELRYIEYKYENGQRKHQISAVLYSGYLELVLQKAATGITINEMKLLLTEDEISDEQAMYFINELLEAQVLVSELEPAITGEEFFCQIVECLERIYTKNNSGELKKTIEVLDAVKCMMRGIDERQINAPADYLQIQLLLNQLGVPFEPGKLFQTDCTKISRKAIVSTVVQKQLFEAMEVLNRLNPDTIHHNLASFAARFTERYENKQIPLLEVLDTETGIGYTEQSGDYKAPLVDDILLPQEKETNDNIQWGLIENLLNEKLNAAHKTGSYTIELTNTDLATLKTSDWDNLPPSMSVMFRLINGDQPVYLESVSGSSAVNLLGRFAHANNDINQLAKDIVKQEQNWNPEVIFAEIIHLPESRIGNILLHPRFRQYEIPYLAKSSVDNEFCINVNDLLVTVSNNKVVLRSKQLNKIIIPRLSTAHNYSLSALPLYHFLCDLQHQDKKSGLYFTWGSLAARFQFLPKVVYKQVVLSPATWQFSQKILKHLLNETGCTLQDKINAFRKQWQLPVLIILAEGDNELLINLEDPLSTDMLLNAIKNKPAIVLKEFLHPAENAVQDVRKNVYCNQFVASIVKTGASFKSNIIKQTTCSNASPQRSFAPGSPWLYYKIYCGAKSADKILVEKIWPLVQRLRQEGLLTAFFFVRYNDPSFHIRIRFLLNNSVQNGRVMELVHAQTHTFLDQGFIWKIQLDTYQRELERYGPTSMELSETLFYHDSIAVLQMLILTAADERENIRWIWTLRGIDCLLNDFRFNLDQKLQLSGDLKNSFLAEFNADKLLKSQLNHKYNENRKLVEFTMNEANDDTNEIKPLLDILDEKSFLMQTVANTLIEMQQNNTLQVSMTDLLTSYIHMLINRSILAKPRLHELVIYDTLHRYYFSQKARKKNENTPLLQEK